MNINVNRFEDTRDLSKTQKDLTIPNHLTYKCNLEHWSVFSIQNVRVVDLFNIVSSLCSKTVDVCSKYFTVNAF